MSGIPFGLLDLLGTESGDLKALKSSRVLKALRVLRFLKLTRLLKGTKILQRIDRDTLDSIEDVLADPQVTPSPEKGAVGRKTKRNLVRTLGWTYAPHLCAFVFPVNLSLL